MDFLKIYIIDIVLVLLFISWVVYYYRKGFVRSVLEFCSFFAAAVVTRAYYVPLADWIRANTSFCSGTAGEYKAKFIAMIILFIADPPLPYLLFRGINSRMLFHSFTVFP